MANVIITKAPVGELVPFTNRPLEENTFAPRGRILFPFSAAFAAKIATNTQTLLVNMTLPGNFAYTVDTIHYSVEGLDVDNINALGRMDITFRTAGTPDLQLELESKGLLLDNAQVDNLRSFGLVQPFREVFYDQNRDGDVVVSLATFDTDGTNASAAGVITVYCTFLQYDIRQAEMVNVNAPAPVSLR